jgi:hypothetical protein
VVIGYANGHEFALLFFVLQQHPLFANHVFLLLALPMSCISLSSNIQRDGYTLCYSDTWLFGTNLARGNNFPDYVVDNFHIYRCTVPYSYHFTLFINQSHGKMLSTMFVQLPANFTSVPIQ